MNINKKFFHSQKINKWREMYLWPTSLVLLAGVCGMKNAFACEPPTAYITPPSIMSIDPALPIGTLLGVTTLTSNSASYGPSNCDWGEVNNPDNVLEIANGIGIPNGKLYPTPIEGVSYRVSLSSSSSWPFYGEYAPVQGYGNMVSFGDSGTFDTVDITLELVKTGPMLSAGTFPAQPILVVSKHYNGDNTGPLVPFYRVVMSSPVTIQPTVSSCTITSPNIVVLLDDINQSILTNIGSTAGDKVFYIPLNCSSNTNISLYFSGDVADPNNSVFKNTNITNAANVGIQLLDSTNAPVSITPGEYVSVGPVSGPQNYPVTARYYALGTGDKVGDVKAIVYASIVYN